MYAERLIVAEHERADIERGAGRGRRPVLLHGHKREERLHGVLLRDLRQAETLRRAVHAADVLDRAEELHLAVRTAVRLQSLENLHAVMQYGGCGMQREWTERHDACVMPAFVRAVIHDKHMIGKHLAEAERAAIRLFGGMRRLCNLDFHTRAPRFFSVPACKFAGIQN